MFLIINHVQLVQRDNIAEINIQKKGYTIVNQTDPDPHSVLKGTLTGGQEMNESD